MILPTLKFNGTYPSFVQIFPSHVSFEAVAGFGFGGRLEVIWAPFQSWS
jgi:hypothetical protein